MSITSDPWFKRLWFVNGILLLIFLLLVGGLLVYQLIQEQRPGTGEAAVSMPDSARSAPARGTRAVRYSEPAKIVGTEARLVRVRYGSEFTPPGLFEASAPSFGLYDGYYSPEPLVNVVFLDSSGARLLFDRPAYIRRLRFPSEPEDSLQDWISYEVALEDRNGDGKLSEDDGPTLFLSDLEGRRLRRVLPPQYVVTWHGAHMGQRSILVYALEVPPDMEDLSKEQFPQRAFLYDLASDSMALYEELNVVIETASQLLSR